MARTWLASSLPRGASSRVGSSGPTPVFPTVAEAVRATRAEVSMIFSPPFAVKAEVEHTIAAGVRTIIGLTEHVPVLDALVLRHRASRAGVTWIGPNSSGVLSPGRAKAGFFVEDICVPGRVGVITKSGSLAYAVMAEMRSAGIGVSTVVAIGGDAVRGTDSRDVLTLFQGDPDTYAVVLLGEIGGQDEEDAAAFVAEARFAKPVVAFIAGRSVPPGQSMGHAGAIARRGRGDYELKRRALDAAGIRVAETIGAIPGLLTQAIGRP